VFDLIFFIIGEEPSRLLFFNIIQELLFLFLWMIVVGIWIKVNWKKIKNGIFLINIFYFYLFFIFLKGCEVETSCRSCTEKMGCGWCGATQTCIEGNNEGPLTGSCEGHFSWSFGSDMCAGNFFFFFFFY